MKLDRRKALRLAASAMVLPATGRMAWSQTYPARPIHVIVPVAPGGSTDILARLLAQSLSERIGQPVIVENRAGAGINIGTEAAVRSPPDGYTLLLVNVANATNSAFYEKLSFNFRRDITPVAAIDRQPYVMLVRPSLPTNGISEFVAYAKAHPGGISLASTGNGTGGHLCGELFKMLTGINMVHVPYRGSALAMTDLIGGQVDVYFGSVATSVEHIKAGRLRALAVTTTTRSETIPDVPTMSDFLPGYEASFWSGIGAPHATPVEIVGRLNREINAVLGDARFEARLADLGTAPTVMSPEEFGKFVDAEIDKWSKVAKFAGIRPS